MRREVEMQEVDWTTFPKPSEEMQSRWLLQHSPKPKKKTVRKQTCTWTLAFIGIGVVTAFSMTIGALTHHHHYQQQAREAYNMALHTGLKFFNSRRSGRLPDENNITWRGDSCIRDRKYHVGSAGTERYCGMRPEGIDYERKVDICISECPNLAKEPEEEYIFSLLIELLYIFSTYLYSSSGSLGILIIARRE
ncbi:hypothetical protein Bca4012_034338 [Brassica carinata]